MGKTSTSLPYRRSARVNIACPVRLSGTLPTRTPFAETARIVTLSKFGAKIKTSLPLNVGMQVKLQPLRGKNEGVFNVVWVGREGTPRAGEVGVECTHGVASILGITFPDLSPPLR